jgi:AraC family transcriptional regulator
MEVDVTERPELRVAALRHAGPYDRISETFARLGAKAGEAGLIGAGGSMIAVYYDDPRTIPSDSLRANAGITIPATAKLPAGLVEVKVRAGRYAHTIHKGPYDRLGDTWARLRSDGLPQEGLRAGDGPGYEIYRNTPMTAAPDKLLTDLYLPVK